MMKYFKKEVQDVSYEKNKTSALIKLDIERVRSQVIDELEKIERNGFDSHDLDSRLLYLLQKDLLPGIKAMILESKCNRDSARPTAVSRKSKIISWLFMLVINAAMLFYVALFAMNQTKQRQYSWFCTFLVWFAMEVLIVSTIIVFITHFLIPFTIMQDVRKIQHKLLDVYQDFKLSQRQQSVNDLLVGNEGKSNINSFNVAKYLFVSHRLALRYSETDEAKMILRFSTPWPPHTYQHTKTVSSSYSKKFSYVSRFANVLLLYCLRNFLSAPLHIQDFFMQLLSTGGMGYAVILFIRLYRILPVLPFLPILLIGIITHFVMMSSNANAILHRNSRVRPITTSNKTLVFTSKVQAEINPQYRVVGGDMCANEYDNNNMAIHPTRRASLQAGVRIANEIKKHVNEKAIPIASIDVDTTEKRDMALQNKASLEKEEKESKESLKDHISSTTPLNAVRNINYSYHLSENSSDDDDMDLERNMFIISSSESSGDTKDSCDIPILSSSSCLSSSLSSLSSSSAYSSEGESTEDDRKSSSKIRQGEGASHEARNRSTSCSNCTRSNNNNSSSSNDDDDSSSSS